MFILFYLFFKVINERGGNNMDWSLMVGNSTYVREKKIKAVFKCILNII